MLRLIINSAIQWIKAGLELKSLKVVLFSRNPTKPDKSHKPLFECFQKMKDTYGDKELTYVCNLFYLELFQLNACSLFACTKGHIYCVP